MKPDSEPLESVVDTIGDTSLVAIGGEPAGVSDGLIRLSVGLESADDLEADLAASMAAADLGGDEPG